MPWIHRTDPVILPRTVHTFQSVARTNEGDSLSNRVMSYQVLVILSFRASISGERRKEPPHFLSSLRGSSSSEVDTSSSIVHSDRIDSLQSSSSIKRALSVDGGKDFPFLVDSSFLIQIFIHEAFSLFSFWQSLELKLIPT